MRNFRVIGAVMAAASALLFHGCFAFHLPVTMSVGTESGDSPLARGNFLRTAAVGLIGAGMGVTGLRGPNEDVSAAEPLVETCEMFVGASSKVAASPTTTWIIPILRCL